MIDNISKEFERLFIIGRGCSKDFMYLMELRRLIFGLLHETKNLGCRQEKQFSNPTSNITKDLIFRFIGRQGAIVKPYVCMILYAGNVNPCYISIERQVKTDG